jgi:hypothetical protein
MHAFAQDVAGSSRSRGSLSGEVCRSISLIRLPMFRFPSRFVLPFVRASILCPCPCLSIFFPYVR